MNEILFILNVGCLVSFISFWIIRSYRRRALFKEICAFLNDSSCLFSGSHGSALFLLEKVYKDMKNDMRDPFTSPPPRVPGDPPKEEKNIET